MRLIVEHSPEDGREKRSVSLMAEDDGRVTQVAVYESGEMDVLLSYPGGEPAAVSFEMDPLVWRVAQLLLTALGEPRP